MSDAGGSKRKGESPGFVYGVSFGILIGSAVGMFMDNIAFGLGGGIAIGIACGAIYDAARPKKNKEGQYPPGRKDD